MTDVTKFFLSQAEFVSLPIEQRNKLREVFGIAKSGQVQVRSVPGGSDVLVSDGTEPQDLMSSLNKENILKFLGKEEKKGDIFDFDLLFGEVMKKLFPNESVKEPVAPKEVPLVPIPPKEEVKNEVEKTIVVTQRRGRPKKNG